MPELPEVQTLVDDLKASNCMGARIEKVQVHWPALVVGTDPGRFCSLLEGSLIADIRRRGKYIIWDLEPNGHLVVHLRMSGRFLLDMEGGGISRHVHLVLHLATGRCLMYHDTRKFGRFYLVDSPDIILARLGPEPFDQGLSPERFYKMLARRRRRIKPLLLDQTFLAGLGNIYADEALWEASIHPLTIASSLGPKDAYRLIKAIVKVLRQAIRNRGTSLGKGLNNFASLERKPGHNSDQLKVYRRHGQPCRRCGTSLVRLKVAQRSTHVCPCCQKNPDDLSKC